MPATIAGSHLGPDIHANRPAANAAGQPIGAQYSCTTHGLIYQTDGSTWTTYATLGTAGAYTSGGTDVAVADGGTGASTASGARTNLGLVIGTDVRAQGSGDPTRASLGLDTTDSPQLAGINLGHASDTTLTRTGAGDLAVEGNALYRAGGTDVPIADGGTGASTKAAAFDALSPMTTQDDIIIGGASGTGARLAKGSDGQVLTVDPTTHHLVWATPSGGGGALTVEEVDGSPTDSAVTKIVFPNGTLGIASHVATYTPAGGGGSAIDWALVVNEDGSSFANFTAASGTWASSSGKIAQTDTGGAWRRAKFNNLLPLGFGWIMEAEINFVTTSGDRRAGFAITNGTPGSNGLSICLKTGTGVQIDIDEVQGIRSITTTITHATTYKLRVVSGGPWYSIYLDGTLVGNVPIMTTNFLPAAAEYISLMSYSTSVTFDNIKVWTLSTGAPA